MQAENLQHKEGTTMLKQNNAVALNLQEDIGIEDFQSTEKIGFIIVPTLKCPINKSVWTLEDSEKHIGELKVIWEMKELNNAYSTD